MNSIIWIYQAIAFLFLGYMVCTACADRPKALEWVLIIALAAAWPYAFWLIYRQEVGK